MASTITLVPFNATPENWCTLCRAPIMERIAFSDTERVMCTTCTQHCAYCADPACDHPTVTVAPPWILPDRSDPGACGMTHNR